MEGGDLLIPWWTLLDCTWTGQGGHSFGWYTCKIFRKIVVKKADASTTPRFRILDIVMGMPPMQIGCKFEIDLLVARAKLVTLCNSKARELHDASVELAAMMNSILATCASRATHVCIPSLSKVNAKTCKTRKMQ